MIFPKYFLMMANEIQGFRMLVGDPTNRDASKVPRGLCFRCEANSKAITSI